MKAFFFKQQSIEDKMRDLDSGVLYKDEEGKTENEDYISIQIKVPRKDCNIDFQNMARWSTIRIFEKHDADIPEESGTGKLDKIQVYEAMISLLETWGTELREKIQEVRVNEG